MTHRNAPSCESAARLRSGGGDSHPADGPQVVQTAEELQAAQLAATLRVELCERWRHGERLAAESYFTRYPGLESAVEYAVDLVYCEFLLREELGERPQAEEYLRRFPQFSAQLQRQFALHDELASAASSMQQAESGSAGNRDSAGYAAPVATRGWPAPGLSAPSRIGRFEIKQQLGVGGFGSVYRAYDPQLGRDVALKVPHAHLLLDEHRDRFLREARAAAQLQHPNLVTVYDSGVAAEGCYIAYQLVSGQSLAQSLKRRGFIAREAAELVRKLAQAAHHAHTKGVFHRDLKTANVLIDEQGEPYISDFGLVRVEGDATLTADAAVLGTPAYMSPEQAEGASHLADARSDVYTLGVVLYELLTGQLPFNGPAQSVLRQVIDQDPPRPRSVSERVPRDLETICLKAMAKRPADRYASAEHLADDLGRWLHHEPIQARPGSLTARVLKWARRRPAAAALVAVVLLAVVGVLVVGTWYNIRLRAANLETQRLLTQTQSLLSQAQLERGVQLLEDGDSVGLLHLLEARQTAEEVPRVRDSCSLLWAGWYDAVAARLVHVLGEEGEAERVAFSPSPAASRLATWSPSGARLWNVATGERASELLPHNGPAVVFSPDGELLVTITADGPRVWHTSTGTPREPQFPPLRDVRGVAITADPSAPPLLAVAAGSDVWLGDLATGEYFSKPLQHGANVGHLLAFSRDGNLLVTTGRLGEHGFAQLWQVNRQSRTAEPVGRRMLLHESEILSVAFNDSGSLLATAAGDRARLWDTTTATQRSGVVLSHREAVAALSFSRDGRMATASFDGTAQLWDVETCRPLAGALRHQGPVRTLDFSPGLGAPGLLATGSFDGTIRLWHTASGQPYGWPLRHPGDVTSVVFSPDGKQLASASADGSTRIWRVAVPGRDPLLFGHDSRVYAVALSRDGLLTTGSGDGKCRVWNTSTGELAFEPWQRPGEVVSVATSTIGQRIAIGWTSHAESMVELRDAQTGELVTRPLAIQPSLRAVALSLDGNLLAIGTSGGTVQLWDAATGRAAGVLEHATTTQREIAAAAFGPDGRLLASGGADRTVKLWDVGRRQLHCPPLWHEGPVDALGFSPDGKRLATASRDLVVRFWNTADGEAAAQTIRTQVIVHALAFSPNGRLLATASVDGTARLWDVETGLPCGLPLAHDAFATAVAFSAEGDWLATGSFDKTARLWRLPEHLGESHFGTMRLRTWAALGARLSPEGTLEAIPWQDWRGIQQELGMRDRH